MFSSTDELTLVRQAAGRSAEAVSAKADLLGRYDRAMHQAARTAGFHDRRDHEYDDAVQTAREAFLRGLDHYDPARGASLYGYSTSGFAGPSTRSSCGPGCGAKRQ